MNTEQNATNTTGATIIIYDPWGWEEVPSTPQTYEPITIGSADNYRNDSIAIGYALNTK